MKTIEPITTTKRKIIIRNLTKNDLNAVTEVHLAAFPTSAMTKLGAEAVRRYYEWQLTGPHDVVPIGAFENGVMRGFCFGGVFRGALSGFLGKNKQYLVLRVLTHPWLAFNPLFRERLDNGLRSLRSTGSPQQQEADSQHYLARINQLEAQPKPFGILSIAVNPNYQGGGVGKLLMEESEAIARQRGFKEMRLSVNTDNAQAIGFYESLGWEKIPAEGNWQGRMRKGLEG
jgi:ribosomal protein S18 acetylase RimI-like enzyme